jgi:hypothetical protein
MSSRTSTVAEAKSTLVKAKEDMAQYYNQCCVPGLEYQVRSKVFLDASDICTTLSRLVFKGLMEYVSEQRCPNTANSEILV